MIVRGEGGFRKTIFRVKSAEDSEGVLTLKMTTTQVAETSVINDTSSNHVITFFYLDHLWLLR